MDPRARTTSSVSGNRVYEDVQPQYKWVPGDKEDILLVDLSGFKNEAEFRKEHLRIQIDNYGNLKVSGERPLVGGSGNRWSRFQRILQLPEDCDASGIKATYDNGLLSVVMPKLVRDQPPAPAPVLQPTAAPAEAAPQRPPAAPQAARTPAPAPAPAKDSAAAPTRQESKLPAAGAPLPPPILRRPEDVRSEGKTAADKRMEQVGAPTADGGTAPTADKKEAEPAADVVGRMESPPPVPADKATPHVRKPPTAMVAPAAEEERPRLGTGGVDLGALSRRPRRLLVNVVVAVMVLVGLGFYLVYRSRARGSPDGQEYPVGIRED